LMSIILYNCETLVENRFLDEEMIILESRAEEAEQYREQLVKWRAEYDRVGLLWQYHTVHLLDLFEAIAILVRQHCFKHVGEKEPIIFKEALELLNEKIQVVIDGMGDPSLYLDSGFIQGEWWPDVSDHLQRSIGVVREMADAGEMDEVIKHLDTFFGMIMVRVMGAVNLPNTDGQGLFASKTDLTDGFVIVRLQSMDREAAPKTRVISDNLNPRWEEEFCFMVCDEGHLTLEVYDSNEDNWMTSTSRQGIGFVRINFRSNSGQWVKRQEKLRSLTRGKLMEASLDFELFFASCIKHLAFMESEQGVKVSVPASSWASGNTFNNPEASMATTPSEMSKTGSQSPRPTSSMTGTRSEGAHRQALPAMTRAATEGPRGGTSRGRPRGNTSGR